MNTQSAKAWALPVLIVAVGLFVVGWLILRPVPEKAGEVVIATPAKEVQTQPKEEVAIPKVTVYQGGAKLKKKLALPATVADNNKEKVLASSKVPAGARAKTVTTVINTETGQSETYVRTDTLPWLAIESRGEIGIYYGIKNGQQAIRLQAQQNLIQVKALHLGAVGSVDMAAGKPDYFVGVGVSYKW